MAKRTYYDANGYKKKRRKRGTPEFATIAEYDAYLKDKIAKAKAKNPNFGQGAVKKKKDPLVELVKQMEEKLDKLEKGNDDHADEIINGK